VRPRPAEEGTLLLLQFGVGRVVDRALMLGSFLHPRVKKALAKYRGAGHVFNAAARR
jgi:hypothetical protein